MASDQDEHRVKRFKTAEDIGGNSTSSTTPSASRLNARPEPPSPYDPLSASSHFNNTHPPALADPVSTPQANRGLYHDAPDNPASKGKEIALPFRDRRGVSQTTNESAHMEDVASSPVDHEHNKDSSGESDHHQWEDDRFDYSASKGKGRALDSPMESRTKVLHGAVDRNSGEASDEEMKNPDDDDDDDDEVNQEDRDREEDSGEGGHDDNQVTVEPGFLGERRAFLQVPPAEPVDFPVQELRLREDGTWDVGPEGRK